MNLLVVSYQYFPVVGGIPVVARLLSKGLVELEHTVRLVTATACTEVESDPFEVYRVANPIRLLKLFWWADKVIIIGPSLRIGWPALFIRKPTLMSHQAGVPSGKFQRLLSRLCKNVACSNYLAKQIGLNTIGVSNPFDSQALRIMPLLKRDRDWIYVGRLVPEKGADVLLRAVAELKKEGKLGRCTIVGAGEEELPLKALAQELFISHLVEFKGPLFGEDLANTIARHHTGVVPSIWQEPFGIVALELIACGCAVIGSDVGGLPEAVGSCGVLFEKGSFKDLASQMKKLLDSSELRSNLISVAREHLFRSEPRVVALRYLDILS